jgi:hypothetical protein
MNSLVDGILLWGAVGIEVACAIIMTVLLAIPRKDRTSGERFVIAFEVCQGLNIGESILVIFILVVFSPIVFLIWWVTW